MAARSFTSRAIGVHDLPPATAQVIREQAALGELRDPLPEVTHGLRTVEETTRKRAFRAPRTTRRTVELLLTPELLVVTLGRDDDAEVGLHRLDQLEFSAAPAELLAKVTGMPVDVPEGLMPVTSTPVGGTHRTTRYVPIGTGPEVAGFRAALTAAVERSRQGA